MAEQVWAIVLAAGSGTRLQTLTGGTPKQFWRPPGGGSSLLDTTLARLRPLVPTTRIVTVVDRTHRCHTQAMPDPAALGEVIYQPGDRGTAAGVLLPLLDVLHRSPEALVVVTPSDHGVRNEGAFRDGLADAIDRVQGGASQIVLFGIEPTVASTDYGWIMPARRGGAAFQPVAGFVEKPPLFDALRLLTSGAVWNTMVLVARAGALFARYREHLPFLTDVLTAAPQLDASLRERFLADWYPELPRADFSHDLLTHAQPLDLFTWPARIGWSDLGTPERLAEWFGSRSSRSGDATRPRPGAPRSGPGAPARRPDHVAAHSEF